MVQRIFSRTLLWGSCLLISTCALAQPLPERYPLTGKIVDQFGAPIPSATVTLRRQDHNPHVAYWGGFASTGPDGKFKFPEAEEGKYYLNADLGGYSTLSNSNIIWEVNKAPLSLVMQKLATLRLKLTKPDNSPLASTRIQVRLRGDMEAGVRMQTATTDSEGILTVTGVYPSTYSIFAAANGQGYTYRHQEKIQWVAEPAPVPLQLQGGGELKLVVAEKAGAEAPLVPVGGASLVLTAMPGIEALDGPGATPNPGENLATVTSGLDRSGIFSSDGEGLIQLKDLPPGKYRARVYLSGRPPAEKEIEISGSSPSQVEITFPPVSAGRVHFVAVGQDGKPLANRAWTVRVMSLSGNTEEPVPGAPVLPRGGARRATSNAEGKFTLYPLRPGKYRFWVAAYNPDGETGPAVNVQAEATSDGSTVTVRFPTLP